MGYEVTLKLQSGLIFGKESARLIVTNKGDGSSSSVTVEPGTKLDICELAHSLFAPVSHKDAHELVRDALEAPDCEEASDASELGLSSSVADHICNTLEAAREHSKMVACNHLVTNDGRHFRVDIGPTGRVDITMSQCQS